MAARSAQLRHTRQSALRAIERGACYLAHLGDEVVGTLAIDDDADPEFWTPTEQAEPALYLHRMIIARPHAGRDLGQALVDFADDLATRAGAHWLRLDSWKDNTELHVYDTRQGFQHLRTIDLAHRGSGALFQRPVASPSRQPPTRTVLASTTDPDGLTVELTTERWRHIIAAHPELAAHQTHILDAVGAPTQRTAGRQANEAWYFLRGVGPSRWLQSS